MAIITGSNDPETLNGTKDADEIRGLGGNDVAFMGDGDDVFVWNPGDGSDVVEGGAGTDLLRFNGADIDERFDVLANGGRTLLLRDVAAVAMDLDDVERLEIHAGAGADTVTVGDLAGTDVQAVAVDLAATPGGSTSDKQIDHVIVNGSAAADTLTVTATSTGVLVTGMAAQVAVRHADQTDLLTLNGGQGDDTIDAGRLAAGKISLQINGGLGVDHVLGSAGDDIVTGGDGDDVVNLGAGNDRFIWNPGDDNDTVAGGSGTDTLQFNGANIAEVIDIADSGGHARFTRNVANIVMDLNDVERIEFKALGGADVIAVHDLSKTDVKAVAIDLAGNAGTGDGSFDAVSVEGSGAGNSIKLTQSSTENAIAISGLPGTVTIGNAEATDQLTINGLGGNDKIDASAIGGIDLRLNGGIGNDTLIGSKDANQLNGDEGNDTIIWNPGGGNDTVNGGADFDTLVVNGGGVGERFDIVASGANALLLRDIDAAQVSLAQVEQITLHASGGPDSVTVGDLTGTGITKVAIGLGVSGTSVGGDADSITINGTAGDDAVNIASVGGQITVSGLAAEISIVNEGKGDLLTINGQGGNDTIDASKLAAGLIGLTLNGGIGADTLIGSAGNDLVNGGDGDDTVDLGAGNDRFVWNPGDDNDTVKGGAGTDTLQFNGANIAEVIDISATGDHVRFTRNVANIVMDLSEMERIEFKALGGADTISVHDLSKTAVKEVAIDLAGNAGTGDGAIDSVSVDGSAENNTIKLTQSIADNLITVTGLPGTVTIRNAESTDLLTINGLGGDDRIDASAFTGNGLTVNGGADFDTLVMNGGAAGERFDIIANGPGGALLLRDNPATQIGLTQVEQIALGTGRGADTVTIGDLSGSGITKVAIDLASSGAPAGSDIDSITANGTASDDTVKVSSAGGKILVSGLAAEISIDHAGKDDLLAINGQGGTDTIDASKLAAGLIGLALNGGLGNDTLIGGAGNDLVFGQDGNDLLNGGAGDDRFVWNPGDDNDAIDGGIGTDTLQFSGANIAEIIDISANGDHARFTRNVANVALDLDNVERVEFKAFGGADTITVHDMTGTDVKQAAIDLSANAAGTGDGAADTVTVIGGTGNDTVTVSESNGIITVAGFAAKVTVSNAEANQDRLLIDGNAGDDKIDASTVPADRLLTIDGGEGNDTIIGGMGADLLNGGAGNDLFRWTSGHGSDIVNGGTGFDTAQFVGDGGNGLYVVLPNGAGAVVGVDAQPIDLTEIERVEFRPLGGSDLVIVRDLTGSSVHEVAIDLASTANGTSADNKADMVIVDSAFGGLLTVHHDGSKMLVESGAQTISVDHWDKSDTLFLEGSSSGDILDASAVGAGKMQIEMHGGEGSDLIFGGGGNDLIFGDSGNDVINGGAGNDTITGGLGDDILTGGLGADTFHHTGILDGHDIINDFDGDAAGGQDVLSLDGLLDSLGIGVNDRAGHVSLIDNGNSVDVNVDADGNAANGFELTVATLRTADTITVGADVLLGS